MCLIRERELAISCRGTQLIGQKKNARTKRATNRSRMKAMLAEMEHIETRKHVTVCGDVLKKLLSVDSTGNDAEYGIF